MLAVRDAETKKYGYLSVTNVEAETPISVYLDGKKIEFTQNPIIENGTTLVPMRAIFEALNANIEWDSTTNSVYAKKDGKDIKITVNNNVALVNNQPLTLSTAAKNVNGSVLVPVRFVSEQLNVNVDWNETTRTINLTSK